MPRLAALLASILCATAACGGASDDPVTADLKRLCAIRPDPSAPPDMARALALRTIADKIKTPEVARLLRDAMQAAPSDRPGIIEPALAKAGIKRCPVLQD